MQSSKIDKKMEEETISSQSPKSDLDTIFHIYVFQPKENYYYLSFDEKMKILEENINAANKNIKQQNGSTPNKNIFVAPEYLFKDFSKVGDEKYYSHEEKKKFKNQLLKLSKDSDLILIPGSICWKKPSKTDSKIYYRNMLYIIHNGQIQKYKKRNPAIRYDFDFTKGNLPNQKFFKKGTDNNVIAVNGICIGVEICLDNPKKELKEPKDFEKIDVQLIIADGVSDNYNLINKVGTIALKVERTGNFETVVGQQQLVSNSTEKKQIELAPPDKTEIISDDLICHTFHHVSLKNEIMNKATCGQISS